MAGVANLLVAGGYPRLSSRSIITNHAVGGSIALYASNQALVRAEITGGSPDIRNFDLDWAGNSIGLGLLYEVMLTVISGSAPTFGGGVGVWNQPNPGDVSWGRPTALGANNFIWQLQVRLLGAANSIAIAQYTFNVTGT